MRVSRSPRPVLAGLAVIALMVAACGGSAASVAPSVAPTVAPTTAPTPTPTPEPSVDVVSAVTEQLQDPAFAAHFDVEGAMQVGTVDVVMDGTYDVDGEEWTSVLVSKGPITTTTESRLVDGVAYSRTDDKEWLIDEASSGLDFGTFGLGLEEAGMETRDGVELHRLVLADPSALDTAFLGLDPNLASDVEFDLELFTTAGGDLAVMAMTISALLISGGVELPIAMDMDFVRDPDAPVEIADAPDEPWAPYHSDEYGFTIATPEGWTADGLEDDIEWFQAETASLSVRPFEIDAGTTLEEYGALVISDLEEIGFGEPVDRVDVTLGVTAEPGIAFLYTDVDAEFEGDNVVYLVTIHDGVAYDFGWSFRPGDFGAQGTLVDRFLSTFSWD